MNVAVQRVDGHILSEVSGANELNLTVMDTYQKGDKILVTGCEEKYIWLTLDQALGESMVYVTGPICYMIPMGDDKLSFPPSAFTGRIHNIHVRNAERYEIQSYYNLALNVNDQHENQFSYPHVSANVETRGEAVFAARNAIDGMTANHAHGIWPYSSWGINQNPDAELFIDFGRKVEANEIIIYLRADFPHDSWWTNLTILFSNGKSMEISLDKTDQAQHFVFPETEMTSLTIKNLQKAKDDSPFPALTQVKVMGWNVVEKNNGECNN